MSTSLPPQTNAFPHQAAKLSWVCPIIVFVLVAFGGPVASRLIIELVALLLILVGLVFGIIALFGIRKHGSKSILAPAIVGIILNGLLLLIFITNFMAARAKALNHPSAATQSHTSMKTIGSFLLIALIVISNGCMTSATIHTAEGDHPNAGLGWRMDSSKPEPGYYALLPLTIPLDIATSPIQGICWLALNPSATTNHDSQTKKQ